MQAPNQTSLPVDAVKKSYSLPYVSNEHDRLHCERLVNEAILDLTHNLPGPVQLNVPMLDQELASFTSDPLLNAKVIKRYKCTDINSLDFLNKKILVVVGENRGIDDSELKKFACNNNVVIYVNQLSNMRNDYTIEGNLMLSIISQEVFDKEYCPDL
jgi:2-succinyl-5-enolpyruvyl-6-hydroxy-3-cyclohexene-1-carboxylate synthase